MDENKEAIILSLKVWFTKTEKERNISEDELALIVSNYVADIMYLKRH